MTFDITLEQKNTVSVGEKELTLKDLEKILFENHNIHLSENALTEVKESYLFLQEFSKGKLIYGINTGFGPMAQYRIPDEDLIQLQYNLIRSHCSGSGKLISEKDTKSMMIARLSSLMRGFSGINPEMVQLLKTLINNDIYPCIFEHGGVGASGDLVQLAHLALTLIGEGEVMYKGKLQETAEVYKALNIKPLPIYKREGIATLNGTSTMSGVGAVNIIHSKNLLNWSITFSTMINELVEAFDDHFSPQLNIVKHHAGQQKIAEAMRKVAAGSKLIKKRAEVLYKENGGDSDVIIEKVQEYYSIRCIPQILGPILDTIENAEEVVINEINSVNDNPIIDRKNNNVYHGGNFHGDYVSLEMDKLKLAITKLAMLSERQLNYLLNDKLNQKLTPFLNLGVLGFNFGIQGMQFTATSTVAECQTLSSSAYIHSIPNNGDNQDVVSMGTNAALITRKVVDNTFEVLAIHAIAVIQAIDGINCADRLSPFSLSIYNELRAICPVIKEDRTMYKNIKEVTEFLKTKKITLV